MTYRSSFVKALALGIGFVLSSQYGWAQRPVTSTPPTPAFQFPPGSAFGFSNNFQNSQFFPAQQFRGGMFTPMNRTANGTGVVSPFGAFGFPFNPFYYGAGGYGYGYPPVVSSVAGTVNEGWVPTGPNWYLAYRPDIAYTAMLNTVGNPPGPGVSPMDTPAQTSGTGTAILRVPEGAEVSVDGKADTESTGGERRLVSPVLKPGQTHTFHVKITWYDDGIDRTRERDITVGPGDSKSLMILPGVAKVEPPSGSH
jgi:uncharacterized protein (TIGR03000 family)